MNKLYFAFILLFTSNYTFAAIIDLNNITLDSDTNLEWLDVTETRGLSYQQVSSMLGSGQLYEGWRYASVSEFETLVSNFGYVSATSFSCLHGTQYCDQNMQTNSQIIENLINTLGDTFDAYWDEINNGLDTDPLAAYLTRGILDSSALTPNVPLIFSTIADQESVYRSDGSPYSDGADALISYHLAIDNLNVIPGTYGSYLVRDATQVSNPNVLYLLMLGSGFVLFLRFNKHK